MAPDQIKKGEAYTRGAGRRAVKSSCIYPSEVMYLRTRGVGFPAVIYIEHGESHICSLTDFAAWSESAYPWETRQGVCS